MDERLVRAVGEQEAYLVGGAVRDTLRGEPVTDIDVVCVAPERAAQVFRKEQGGALFALSERHGAWRVVSKRETVDFAATRGTIEQDLALRDFTVNAIAEPLRGGVTIDPMGGVADVGAGKLRAVTDAVFRDDPLRLLRAVRFERELGFQLDEVTVALIVRDRQLVSRPAGERILGEIERLGGAGFRRLDELGLLQGLGGTSGRLSVVEDVGDTRLAMVAALGTSIERLPVSNELGRYARTVIGAVSPDDGSPRSIHRFRRATEPWAIDALRFHGATNLEAAVRSARAKDPATALVRGDELGVPPGPKVGRLLEAIAEERAAGTITTRAEALAFAQQEQR